MMKLKIGVVCRGVASAAIIASAMMVSGVLGTADGAVVSSASASRGWVEKEIVKATNGLAKATDIPTNVVEIGGLPAYRPYKSLPNNWYAGFARADLVGFDVETFGVGGIYQNATLSDEGMLSLTVRGPMTREGYSTSSNTVYGVDGIRRRYTYLSGSTPLQWDYYYRYPAKSGTFAMAEDLDEKVDVVTYTNEMANVVTKAEIEPDEKEPGYAKNASKAEEAVEAANAAMIYDLDNDLLLAVNGSKNGFSVSSGGTKSNLIADGSDFATSNTVVRLTSPKEPISVDAIRYAGNGTGIIVSIAEGGTLGCVLDGWPNLQSQTALITLGAGAEVDSRVKLIGYGAWPTEKFLASCIRVGETVYVNAITVVAE